MSFINCRTRLTFVLAGDTRGKKGSGGGRRLNEVTGCQYWAANIMISLFLQPQCWLNAPVFYVFTPIFLLSISTATVLAERSCFLCFHSDLSTLHSCQQTWVRWVSHSSPLFILFFCHFTFPGFPFTLIYINAYTF